MDVIRLIRAICAISVHTRGRRILISNTVSRRGYDRAMGIRWGHVWVCCALGPAIGCGDDLTAGPAAGRPDAGREEADAAPPAFGLATVFVRPGGEPAEGVPVLFQDADGEVVGEELTDADGRAALEIGRDSMVTLMLWDDLHTVTAVQPEDVVELWSPPYRFDSPVVGRIRIAGRPVAGAVDYWIGIGCEPLRGSASISPSAFITLREDCLAGDGTFDVVVQAIGEDYRRLRYGYRTDVTPDADGTTRVAIEWEPEVPTVEFSYVGDRPGVRQFFGEIAAQRKGLPFVSDGATSEDGSPVVVHHLAGFADSVRIRAAVVWDGGYSDIVRSIPTPIPASLAVSDGDLTPMLSDGSVDMSTPTRPIASWTGDTAEVDGLHIQFTFYDGSTGEAKAWFVAVPPGSNQFRFPVLSDALAPLGPDPYSVLYEEGAWVAAMAADFADGYDDFRNRYLLGYWDSYHPDGEPTYAAAHTLIGLHDAEAAYRRRGAGMTPTR